MQGGGQESEQTFVKALSYSMALCTIDLDRYLPMILSSVHSLALTSQATAPTDKME